jgi:hypothetical protein
LAWSFNQLKPTGKVATRGMATRAGLLLAANRAEAIARAPKSTD